MRAVASVLVLMMSLSVAVLAGQDRSTIAFEVASVKPAADRDLREVISAVRPRPGQWRLFGVTLQNALLIAYPEFQLPGLLAGGPDWINDKRFDFQARLSPTTTHAELQTMIRRLLEERFQLRMHTERRMLDVYDLTLKTPGKLGPGLTPASTTCVVHRLIGGPAPDCDIYAKRGAEGGVAIAAATISELISVMSLPAVAPGSSKFSNAIDRPVVDKTGLDGYFQIVGPSAVQPRGGGEPFSSFFTLMEEQLGLKLTKAREMVDVLVIDSASFPDPD